MKPDQSLERDAMTLGLLTVIGGPGGTPLLCLPGVMSPNRLLVELLGGPLPFRGHPRLVALGDKGVYVMICPRAGGKVPTDIPAYVQATLAPLIVLSVDNEDYPKRGSAPVLVSLASSRVGSYQTFVPTPCSHGADETSRAFTPPLFSLP